MSESSDDHFVLYRYDPSLPAAAIFAVLFAILAIIHIFQLVVRPPRLWAMIPIIIGALMEAIGYVGRILSTSDPTKLGPYIMQSLLLLIAPALMAASIYMLLGRLIVYVADEQSYGSFGSTRAATLSAVRLRWLTKIFVTGDILSFFIQSGGGGLMAQEGKQKLGEKIVIVGLFTQILFFGLFMVVSFVFHHRANAQGIDWRGGKKILFTLYASSALILVRSTFRVIEYIMGNDGVLMKNEIWLYLFDATLMFVAVAVFNKWHPKELLGVRESKNGNLELESRGNRRSRRSRRQDV